MAFIFKRYNNRAVVAPSIKELAATSGVSYKVGDALGLSSGKAVKVTGTAVPEYICAAEKTAGANETIVAYAIDKDQEYETVLSTDGSLVVGAKYTIASDSAKVTATSTSGVAEVVKAEGTTAGSVVVVKF